MTVRAGCPQRQRWLFEDLKQINQRVIKATMHEKINTLVLLIRTVELPLEYLWSQTDD